MSDHARFFWELTVDGMMISDSSTFRHDNFSELFELVATCLGEEPQTRLKDAHVQKGPRGQAPEMQLRTSEIMGWIP